MAPRNTRPITDEPGGGAASLHGDHAVIHDSHQEADHHAGEPPGGRASRRAELVTTACLFGAAVLSWMALWRVGFSHQ